LFIYPFNSKDENIEKGTKQITVNRKQIDLDEFNIKKILDFGVNKETIPDYYDDQHEILLI
jgi:hypothetical protein